MTNKIEIEFNQQSNYEGSRIFSSVADLIGLSVDLVSGSAVVSPWAARSRFPPKNPSQPYCESEEENLAHPPAKVRHEENKQKKKMMQLCSWRSNCVVLDFIAKVQWISESIRRKWKKRRDYVRGCGFKAKVIWINSCWRATRETVFEEIYEQNPFPIWVEGNFPNGDRLLNSHRTTRKPYARSEISRKLTADNHGTVSSQIARDSHSSFERIFLDFQELSSHGRLGTAPARNSRFNQNKHCHFINSKNADFVRAS